eukprot:1685522-Amphidinium_carterae.1
MGFAWCYNSKSAFFPRKAYSNADARDRQRFKKRILASMQELDHDWSSKEVDSLEVIVKATQQERLLKTALEKESKELTGDEAQRRCLEVFGSMQKQLTSSTLEDLLDL